MLVVLHAHFKAVTTVLNINSIKKKGTQFRGNLFQLFLKIIRSYLLTVESMKKIAVSPIVKNIIC